MSEDMYLEHMTSRKERVEKELKRSQHEFEEIERIMKDTEIILREINESIEIYSEFLENRKNELGDIPL